MFPHRVTFGALSDDVLLEIFDFYQAIMSIQFHWLGHIPEDTWHTLVHVCKRWRSIVFASPHRLQLQLLCKNNRPVHTLNIWPELPIVISGRRGMSKPQDADNLLAALTQHDRVAKIDLGNIPNSFLIKIRAREMRDPFSALTSLLLSSPNINAPALPDSFLGGSAPRLQTLILSRIPFPALPKLVLSTHDLVQLRLSDIPLSGYISPEAMVTYFSTLIRLQVLRLEFQSPRSRADRETRLVPRLTRLVLPALVELYLKGDSEFLEDIVAQIDTPLLSQLKIPFFNQLIFDTPLLGHFISRTETFKAPRRAREMFRESKVEVGLDPQDGNVFYKISSLEISCRPSDWQLSSLTQVCDSALSPLPTLEFLEINIGRSWKDDVENAQYWLELLHSFTSIKDLLLRDESIQHVALTLEKLAGERETEVLPALQFLFSEGPQPSDLVKEAIGKFVAARQLSGRPVSVHHRTNEQPTWQQVHWEAGNRPLDAPKSAPCSCG